VAQVHAYASVIGVSPVAVAVLVSNNAPPDVDTCAAPVGVNLTVVAELIDTARPRGDCMARL
jgi:hypothetical protein